MLFRSKCQSRCRYRKNDVGEARVADDAIDCGGSLRLLAGDALRRTGIAGLSCRVLRRGRRLTWKICGSARRKNEARKAANRAERASSVPRREKDHAFGLNGFDERNRIRVLDNNIDEQRATLFPEEWSHSITQRRRDTFTSSPQGTGKGVERQQTSVIRTQVLS